MERSDLQSLLEELKNSFDYERFRDSKKPGKYFSREVPDSDIHSHGPGDRKRRGPTINASALLLI